MLLSVPLKHHGDDDQPKKASHRGPDQDEQRVVLRLFVRVVVVIVVVAVRERVDDLAGSEARDGNGGRHAAALGIERRCHSESFGDLCSKRLCVLSFCTGQTRAVRRAARAAPRGRGRARLQTASIS